MVPISEKPVEEEKKGSRSRNQGSINPSSPSEGRNTRQNSSDGRNALGSIGRKEKNDSSTDFRRSETEPPKQTK